MKRHLIFALIIIIIMLAAAGVSLLAKQGRPAASPTPAPGGTAAVSASPAPATKAPTPPPETAALTPTPTAEPTPTPTAEPTPTSTAEPTPEPTPAPTPEPTPEPTPAPTPNPNGYAEIDASSPALLGETADMGQDYIDQVIYLGDSTTYGMKYYAVLSGGKSTNQVWTPSSGTLTLSYQGFAAIVYPDDGTEITIREAVEKKKPAMMIITLGVNGVSFMDRESFISEYTDLVTDIMELSPDTKVIIQSIFPVAKNYEYLGSINNEKITRANTWLLEVAENTGARYLNTISVLMGSDGYLIDAYQNGDGLHLNADGFRLVLDYQRTHGWD